jgi:putative membrane protein
MRLARKYGKLFVFLLISACSAPTLEAQTDGAVGAMTDPADPGDPGYPETPAPRPALPAMPPVPQEAAEQHATALAETDLVVRIHEANLHDGQLGHLAREKGGNNLIRSLGSRLAKDSELANRRLTNLARERNISAPAYLASDAGDAVSPDLAKLRQSTDFDADFLRLLKASTDEKLRILDSAKAQMPRSSEIFRYVSLFAPLMEQHRRVADNLSLMRLSEL